MWGNLKDQWLRVGPRDVQTFPVELKFLLEENELWNDKVLGVAIGASSALCLVSRSA